MTLNIICCDPIALNKDLSRSESNGRICQFVIKKGTHLVTSVRKLKES